MTSYEKARAAAMGFAAMADPYEMADQGIDEGELVDMTTWLLLEEPWTVLTEFGGMEARR